MSLMRVLHVVGGMNRGGAETMLMNLYRAVDRQVVQFDFLYFKNQRCDYDDEILEMGGNIIRVADINPVLRFFKVIKVVKKGGWDIVHSHTLFSSGLHLAAARIAGANKLVVHSHSTNDGNGTSFLGRLYQRVMRELLCLVVTDYVACGTAAANYLLPRTKDVNIIPNSIQIERFVGARRGEVRRELGLRSTDLLILQVGRFIEVKNHIFSIDIAKRLKENNEAFRLLFVGAGDEKKNIEKLIQDNSLNEHVLLLGVRGDIPELMAEADVMLMPSLYEGFPVVLVESQAAGLPALVSSTVSDEVDFGLGLIKFINIDQEVDEWVESVVNVNKIKKLSAEERCKILTLNGFSVDSGVEKLLQVYGLL